MKKTTYACVMSALLCCVGVTWAATQKWTYERPMGLVEQILADGGGGCALMAHDTTSVTRIAWLGSKGEVVYEALLPIGTNSLGVMSCNKQTMVYSISAAGSASVVTVTKKGKSVIVTSVADPTHNIQSTLSLYPVSLYGDKKGFFAISATKAPPNVSSVVRYSYK